MTAKNRANRAELFLRIYARTASITRAAEMVGIDRSTHYRRLRKDPVYKQRFEQIYQDESFGVLEDECIRRAVEGVNKPLTFQGMISLRENPNTGKLEPVTVKEYSDSCLQFLMRGRKPHIYRERFQHDHKHEGSVGLKFAGDMSDLLALYHRLASDDGDDLPKPE